MTQLPKILSANELKIRGDLETMAGMSIEALKKSLHCLSSLDRDLAKSIIAKDADIDGLKRQIEEDYITTLARRQPVAKDLRELVSASHLATELERIADHSVSIAKNVLAMKQAPADALLADIIQLGEHCVSILKQVVQAYTKFDLDLAMNSAIKEKEIDAVVQRLLEILVQQMTEHREDVLLCTKLISICHDLERIGDRASNIAERVVYCVSGENVNLNDDLPF